jgi:AcrR family transcriptional regulator
MEGMERMLHAAEEVFGEKDFGDVTLAEIAARAGYTIGAFYARFTDKDALLRTLEERLYATVEEVLGRRAEAVEEGAMRLTDFLRAAVADAATIYRQRRGTFRALIAVARQDPALRARMDRVNAATIERFTRAVERYPGGIAHPRPRIAAEFALVMIASTLRETILFADGWSVPRSLDDETLVEELSRSVVSYLGLSDEP